jgi:H/ACA ribonucleoprotein complex subunit 3
MRKNIFHCFKCDKFTFLEVCSCSEKTYTTKPAKFSPEDKWGKYRRIAKSSSKDL